MMTKIEVAAVPAFYQRYHGKGNYGDSEYRYEREPYCDISVLFRVDWLDEYQFQAPRWEMTWANAIMWGKSLQQSAGQAVPEDEEENQQIKRVIEIADWVQYWGHESFGLRQKRDDNAKVTRYKEDVPHMTDEELYEIAYAEFHPTREAVRELVGRHSIEEVAENIGIGERRVENIVSGGDD